MCGLSYTVSLHDSPNFSCPDIHISGSPRQLQTASENTEPAFMLSYDIDLISSSILRKCGTVRLV